MFRGSVKGTGYSLHSPVSPSLSLPCVTVCHHVSTGVYLTLFWGSRLLLYTLAPFITTLIVFVYPLQTYNRLWSCRGHRTEIVRRWCLVNCKKIKVHMWSSIHSTVCHNDSSVASTKASSRNRRPSASFNFQHPFFSLTFRHRASSIQDSHFGTLQRTLFIYLINKYISLSDICLTVHHWYK